MVDIMIISGGLIIPSLYLAYTDIIRRVLPTKIIYYMGIVGVIYCGINGDIKSSLLGGLLGFGVMVTIALIGELGGGDIRLATVLGIWLGYPYIMDILLIASIAALVSKLYITVRNNKRGIPKYDKNMEITEEVIKTYGVPFGTCMVVGLIFYIILMIT